MTFLRAAIPADCLAVAALESELFGADAWSPAAVAEELGQRGPQWRRALVAVDGRSVVGYAVLLESGDNADVARIGVSRSHQRRGLATALLASAIEQARAAGSRRLLLEVAADNAAALSLYARHGFTEIARRPRYYSGDVDAVVMQRLLDPVR
ncbi:MAG TPA: ribosomal protein S18-alanine N-acetyltransferase [Nocardioidaceae bacterium]|nr:ribosomal protein S18-alanine N-acetyltransferase [Nocardioidaceae bacterium]